jgi:photosystem II stability/assembly factor-like uncharacterized protein
MKKSKQTFITMLAIFAVCHSLHAQYRWHIVHSDHIDTLFYLFSNISCSGESCSALGYAWSLERGDSNIILHSTDGGLSWTTVEPALPQWVYTWDSKGGLLLSCIEQIDSLDAIAGGGAGTVIRSFDGWDTWQADTFNFPPVVIFHDTNSILFSEADFSNVGEGVMIDAPDGVAFWTSDSGQQWVERIHIGNIHSYGNGMFREYRAGYNFNDPDTILTTLDNWNTVDTTTFSFNGPFLSGDLVQTDFEFGAGDTLTTLAYRYDSTGLNQVATMVRSTNLGANWTELAVPRTNRITNPAVSPVDGQTIVIGGQDSVGEIVISTDRGSTWELDTVPLDNEVPYYWIYSVTVTGSGRVIASIETDSSFEASSVLAYLEPVPSSVEPPLSSQTVLNIFPNPTTNEIQITSSGGNISIRDPLGRVYSVPRNGNMLDISSLPSGVYFVSDGVSRAKFVKE